jgi:Spy/CpxP family protein refolding chaperone
VRSTDQLAGEKNNRCIADDRFPMRKAQHLMRDNIKAFLLASSLAFGIPTFVDAEPLEGASGASSGTRALRWLRQLELTEAQRDQIFRMFHDQAAAGRALSDMALMRAQTMARVAALLTPEQRERLRGLRAL